MCAHRTGYGSTSTRSRMQKIRPNVGFPLSDNDCRRVTKDFETGTAQVDKAAATRFIKHAIAQVKVGRPPGQDEGQASGSGSSDARVPVKITSKMREREEYQQRLREEPSDEEEDELEVFDDDVPDGEQSGAASSSENKKDKGKARARDADDTGPVSGQKRRRPPMDPFAGEITLQCSFFVPRLNIEFLRAGYGDEPLPATKSLRTSPSNSTPTSDTDMTGGDTGSATPVSEAASGSKKAAKKARRRARKLVQMGTAV